MAKHRTDVRQAIRQYEELRMAKASRLVRTARMAGRAAHIESRWLRKARNGVVRYSPQWITHRQTDGMYVLGY